MNKHVNVSIERQRRRLRSAICLFTPLVLGLSGFAQDDEEDEQVFELSPFTVDGSEDQGYRATNTLGGTRIRTELKDVGAAVSVVTEAFMEDTGSNTLEDVLTYTTGTEVGGLGGNFGGSFSFGSPEDISAALSRPASNTRVRGLDSADLTRDFFRTNIGMDSYNTNRIDINRGASALLYGIGSPAGIINNTLKSALTTEDQYSVEFRVDKHGSHREVIDVNKVISEDGLGIRIIGLNDEREYEQDHAFADDRRIYTALKWTPKFGNDSVFTEISANYENGSIDSNRPRTAPPVDRITNWWWTNDGSPAQPTNATPVGNNQPGQGYTGGVGNRWWGELGFIFDDPNSTEFSTAFRQREGNPWGGWGSPNGPFSSINNGLNSGSPHPINLRFSDQLDPANGNDTYARGLWQNQQILDEGVFDARSTLLEGPNKSEFNDFDAVTVQVAQTFMDGKLGYNLSFSDETVESGYTNLVASDGYYISVDINEHLRGNEEQTGGVGVANPNLGRPLFASSNQGNIRESATQTKRATVFYNMDFNDVLDSDSKWADIFGKHTFTATYGELEQSEFSRTFRLYAPDPSYNLFINDPTDPNNGYYNGLIGAHYLGDSLIGNPSATTQRIGGLNAVHDIPASVRAWSFDFTNDQWDFTDVPVVNHRTNIDQLYTGAGGSMSTITNKTAVWQGEFLNGVVNTLIGYREDELESMSRQPALFDEVTNARQPFNPEWGFNVDDPFEASNWSGSVNLHAPEFLREKLPWGMDVTVSYNTSENFNPGQVGYDVYGNTHPAPSGETEDWGLVVSALEGKVSLRANWYETTSTTRQVSGGSWNTWWNVFMPVRAMNGLQRAATPTPNQPNDQQPVTNTVINDWMFGNGGYDAALASRSLDPAADAALNGWRTGAGTEEDPFVYDSSVFNSYLNQPLRIRASADPSSASFVGAAGANNTDNPYPEISEMEQAYMEAWFNARPDAEWLHNFDQDYVNAVGFRRDAGGGWTADGHVGSTFSTSDVVSEGFELELVLNPTDNWRFMFNAAQQKASQTNIAGDLDQYIANSTPFWFDGLDTNSQGYWDFDGPADVASWGRGNSERLGTIMESNVFIPYLNLQAASGRAVDELREWRWNSIVNYSFKEGKFAGLNIGGAARWQDEIVIGYAPMYRSDIRTWVHDLDRPIVADSELNFDFWAGYETILKDGDVNWKIQLNVRNLFGDDDLIPVLAQPDGSIAQARVPNTNEWYITNTFSF